MNALVKVPFYSDTIEAAKNSDGVIYVSVKRVCESLGISFSPQRRKLQCDPLSGVIIMITPDLRGNPQETCVIGLESLPAWLFKINSNKVSHAVREKLVQYQKEAKNVLSAWFLGISSERPELAKAFTELQAKFKQSEKDKV